MSPEETVKMLKENLAPNEIAEFHCTSIPEAKTWYMRYIRAIKRASLSETLSLSRKEKTLFIRHSPPAPEMVIQKAETSKSDLS